MKKRFETDSSSIIDAGKRRGRKRVRPAAEGHSDATHQTPFVSYSRSPPKGTSKLIAVVFQMPRDQSNSSDFVLESSREQRQHLKIYNGDSGFSFSSNKFGAPAPYGVAQKNANENKHFHVNAFKQLRDVDKENTAMSTQPVSHVSATPSPENFTDIFSPLKCVDISNTNSCLFK